LNKHKGKIGEALEQALETEKEIDREIIRHRRRIIKRETIKKEREHEKEHQFQRQKSVLSRMNTINLPSVADMNITFDSHGQRLDIHKVNADALSKKDKTYYPVKYTCLDEDTIVERTSIFRQTQQSILQKKIRNKLSNLFLTKKDEISKAKKETSTLNSPQMDLADDDANSEKKEENNEEEEGEPTTEEIDMKALGFSRIEDFKKRRSLVNDPLNISEFPSSVMRVSPRNGVSYKALDSNYQISFRKEEFRPSDGSPMSS